MFWYIWPRMYRIFRPFANPMAQTMGKRESMFSVFRMSLADSELTHVSKNWQVLAGRIRPIIAYSRSIVYSLAIIYRSNEKNKLSLYFLRARTSPFLTCHMWLSHSLYSIDMKQSAADCSRPLAAGPICNAEIMEPLSAMAHRLWGMTVIAIWV